MRARIWLAVAAFATVAGPAFAQSPQGLATEKNSNPKQTVEGVVSDVDTQRNRVRIRDVDGAEHEFEASADTIRDMKVGDRIEAKRRDADDAARRRD